MEWRPHTHTHTHTAWGRVRRAKKKLPRDEGSIERNKPKVNKPNKQKANEKHAHTPKKNEAMK